jgi:hypothetical protein
VDFERLKSREFSIIFRRLAAILNQMTRDYFHHRTPLRPIVLWLFDLRLIFHKFPPPSPITHTFYLPRPFRHYLLMIIKLLQSGRLGVRNPVEARFPASVQTGPIAHPVPCTTDIVSLSVRQCGRIVILTTQPHLAPKLSISRTISQLPPSMLPILFYGAKFAFYKNTLSFEGVLVRPLLRAFSCVSLQKPIS